MGGVGVAPPLYLFEETDYVVGHKASHAQDPNFAYALTVRKYDGEQLDLSSLKHMIDGAEPVSNESMQIFYKILRNLG